MNWCTSTRLPPCCATKPEMRASSPTRSGAATLVESDRVLVEGGTTGGVTAGVGALASVLLRAQNGFVRSYALTMLLGVVAILGAVWVMQ